MTVYVLTFPGSNCDRDALKAVKYLGYDAQLLWHKDTEIPSDAELIIVPGGFSWGDYLRCGAMSAKAPIMATVKQYADAGGYLLGICNGFQILCEVGLLDGALLRNKNSDFIARPCYLRVEDTDSLWLKKYNPNQVVNFPIAHHDGCYWADDATLKQLEDNGQVLFRYCDAEGHVNDDTNPNGAANNIAAIRNKAGNVIGMMPHPERNVEELISWGVLSGSGAALFQSVLGAK